MFGENKLFSARFGVKLILFDQTGVDDVNDAVDSNRSLGDVGRHDDFTFGHGSEDTVLFFGLHFRVKRDDLYVFTTNESFDFFNSVGNFLLAGHKNENVAVQALVENKFDFVGRALSKVIIKRNIVFVKT